MGHRVVVIALLTATAIGVLGCGGAGKPTRTKEIISFSSRCDNCGHHFTVKQVEMAFAGQGIRLHKHRGQPIPGFVVLEGGHTPHVVATLVKVSATKTKLPRLPHSLRLNRTDLGKDFVFLAEPSGRDYRIQRDGNVAALFDPSRARSVRTAFGRLH